MSTHEMNIDAADNYWRLIKDTTNEVKLKLISLLSESIARDMEKRDSKTDKEATEEFIRRFAGCWHGSETAEEIIGNIYSSRISSNKPNPFDL